LVEDMGMHWTPSEQKLISDLDPKENIVVHHVLLWWMVNNGFKITKIHRVLQFNQKPYLKTFIDTFVNKRSRANSKVKKEMYKLMLNSAFGKMCESVRNRSCCDAVTDPKECARFTAVPNFTSFTSIEKNMVLLHRKKRNVVLNKSIAEGISVLEISKKLMLSFFTMCARYNCQGRGRFNFTMGIQILCC
jgi:hypothetical protein